MALRFARSGYDCAMLVETLQPSMIVMDSALAEVRDGRLVESVVRDERNLGVKVVIALGEGEEMPPREGVSLMAAPLTVEKIERLVRTCRHAADVVEEPA